MLAADLQPDAPDTRLSWSADAQFLLVAGDGPAQRWELARNRMTRSGLQGESLRRTAWSPSGERLAVVTDDGIEVWDKERRIWKVRLSAANTISALAWSADGKRLAVRWKTAEATITVGRVGSGRIEAELPDNAAAVSTLAFAPDGTRLAIRRPRGRVLVWAPATGETVEPGDEDRVVSDIAWSADSTRIVTAGGDGMVTVQDVAGPFRTQLRLPGTTCVDWAATTIAVGRRTGPAVLELRDRSN